MDMLWDLIKEGRKLDNRSDGQGMEGPAQDDQAQGGHAVEA